MIPAESVYYYYYYYYYLLSFFLQTVTILSSQTTAAKVVEGDIAALNGHLHIIDGVSLCCP